jgi:hypothetical protein
MQRKRANFLIDGEAMPMKGVKSSRNGWTRLATKYGIQERPLAQWTPSLAAFSVVVGSIY